MIELRGRLLNFSLDRKKKFILFLRIELKEKKKKKMKANLYFVYARVCINLL